MPDRRKALAATTGYPHTCRELVIRWLLGDLRQASRTHRNTMAPTCFQPFVPMNASVELSMRTKITGRRSEIITLARAEKNHGL